MDDEVPCTVAGSLDTTQAPGLSLRRTRIPTLGTPGVPSAVARCTSTKVLRQEGRGLLQTVPNGTCREDDTEGGAHAPHSGRSDPRAGLCEPGWTELPAPGGQIRARIWYGEPQRSVHTLAGATPISSNARAWSGVGSEGSSKAARSSAPAGTTRLRVRVASSVMSVAKLPTRSPSGIRWSRSFAIGAPHPRRSR